jgi:hypothetical protein
MADAGNASEEEREWEPEDEEEEEEEAEYSCKGCNGPIGSAAIIKMIAAFAHCQSCLDKQALALAGSI